MASTKNTTVMYNNTNLVANAAATAATAVDLQDGYGATLHIKITNGGTGPTVTTYCSITVSADNTNFYEFGRPVYAALGNGVVTGWGGIDIPVGVKYLNLSAGGNTVQNTVIRAEITEVTAV